MVCHSTKTTNLTPIALLSHLCAQRDCPLRVQQMPEALLDSAKQLIFIFHRYVQYLFQHILRITSITLKECHLCALTNAMG